MQQEMRAITDTSRDCYENFLSNNLNGTCFEILSFMHTYCPKEFLARRMIGESTCKTRLKWFAAKGNTGNYPKTE